MRRWAPVAAAVVAAAWFAITAGSGRTARPVPAAWPAPSATASCQGRLDVVSWQPYGPGWERTYRSWPGSLLDDPISSHREPAHPTRETFQDQGGAGTFIIQSSAGPTLSVALPDCTVNLPA